MATSSHTGDKRLGGEPVSVGLAPVPLVPGLAPSSSQKGAPMAGSQTAPQGPACSHDHVPLLF